MALCKGKPPINDISLNRHKKYRVKKFSLQAIIENGLNGYGIMGIRYWVLGNG
jgi:hypothetical protein